MTNQSFRPISYMPVPSQGGQPYQPFSSGMSAAPAGGAGYLAAGLMGFGPQGVVGSALQSQQGSGVPGLGRLAKGVDRYFSDPDKGANRLAMALGAIGTAANVYGAYQQGRQADRDRRDDERRRRRLQPRLDDFYDSVRR